MLSPAPSSSALLLAAALAVVSCFGCGGSSCCSCCCSCGSGLGGCCGAPFCVVVAVATRAKVSFHLPCVALARSLVRSGEQLACSAVSTAFARAARLLTAVKIIGSPNYFGGAVRCRRPRSGRVCLAPSASCSCLAASSCCGGSFLLCPRLNIFIQ